MAFSRPVRILVMEDDARQACLVQRMLEGSGYDVELARDGDEGLTLYRAGDYDLLVINHQMPGKNGIEVLRLLNLWGEPPPLVLVTGHGEEEVVMEAMKLGVGDYVIKDLDGRYLTLLPIIIERLLAQWRLAEEKRQAEASLHQVLDALEVRTADLQRVNAQLHTEMTERTQTEELFRGLLEFAPDAIVIVNQDGQIVLVNAQTEALFGYARHELCGQPVERLLPARLRRAHTAHRRHYVTHPTGRPMGSGLELYGLHKDGHEFPVEISLSPLETAQGVWISSAIRDIAARKQAEQAHRELEDQLRQSQKMEALGILAGGIAHEFNNLLTAILGFAQLIQDAVPPSSPACPYVQGLFEAGRRGQDLVQQILTFSRQSDQGRQPVQLAVLVRDILPLLRASLPTTIALQPSIAEEAGVVLANPTQMHQILMNLCTNAAYAMRDTGGVLAIGVDSMEVTEAFAAAHVDLHPGSYVRLTVHDTGSGIPPEVVEQIFDPFFTTKGVGEGTGMGLAIVHGIVTSYGGTLTVESKRGLGSTFTIYLPQSAAPVDDTEPPEAPIPSGHGCILFVDDEEMLVRVGQDLLTHLGYEVVAHTSSLKALDAFHSEPQRFDVVITDQTMPQMTGEALAQAVRRLRPDMPIILCTGFSDRMNAEKAKAMGIDAFCMKPFVVRDLAVMIQEVLSRQAKE